ncbi:MAG TPA: T9SS type A sorting domain-containing protein, partial [Flavobacteriaceae bacterium]|nr:T9SS type A sorting domain-containing protein [Flavobacteriaceae bacterium]
DFTKGFSNTIYTGSDNWASAYDADRIENLKAYADHVWGNDPGNEAYVIFEHLSDNSEETELANYGIMLWGNLNHSFNQNTMGYSEGADVSWLSYQNRGWNNPHVVGYMESHDEERLMVKNIAYGNSNGDYDIKDLSTALDRQEAASVIFYSVPGPKMLWQFGELGYDKSINCEDDINDGSCRLDEKPVAWTLGYDNDSDRLDLYNLTAKMIMLKTTYPSTFNTTDFSFSLDGLVKRINLNDISGDFDVTVIANFDVTTQSINPIFSVTGTWYDILNNNTPFDVSSSSSTISLEPGEYRVYGTQPVIDPNDLDSDGVPNSDDLCPATPIGAIVDVTGCPVFTLPSDNFLLQISSETCRSSNNGSIAITAQESLNYTITITGNGVNVSDTFTDSYTMDNLEAADYEVCITVDGQSDYEICFNATIDEPEDLSVLSRVSNSEGRVSLDLSGSETYTITFNDQVIETTNSSLTLDLKVGNNSLKVEGKKPCQGIFEKTIYFGSNMTVFPNPVTSNKLSIYLGNTDLKRAHVLLYTILGEAIYNNTLESKDNIIRLDFSPFAKGIYILNVITDVESVSFKVIK